MAGIFIWIVIIIGLLATIGFSVLTFHRTAEIAGYVQKNIARMDTISSHMRSYSRALSPSSPISAPNGIFLPETDPDNPGRMIFDPAIVGSTKTPWGADYGYCPQLDPSADPLSDRFTVFGGMTFITGGAWLPEINVPLAPKTLGFVVAPLPNEKSIPDCEDIVFESGSYVVSHNSAVMGTVSPILLGPTISPSYSQVGEPAITLSAANGDSSLSDPLSTWSTSDRPEFSVYLEDGEYTLPESIVDYKYGNRTLYVVGTLGTTSVLVSGDLVVSANVVFKNVNFPTHSRVVVRDGAKVSLINSRVGGIRVEDGELRIWANSSIEYTSVSRSPIEVLGGSFNVVPGLPTEDVLHITSNATSHPAIRASGGVLNLKAGISALNNSLPWELYGSARLDASTTATYAFDHSAPVAVLPLSVSVEANANSAGIAEVSCPSVRPHPTSASCVASDGVLSSSSRTEDGWRCTWSAPLVGSNIIPLPSDGKVYANCSIAP